MGRPRKYPKVEPTIDVENNKEIQPKIKKKRGRKPKIRTVEELALLSQVGKKKRGRKPKEQFNFNSDLVRHKNRINLCKNILTPAQILKCLNHSLFSSVSS